MIYKVKVRIVQEGTVFVEAESLFELTNLEVAGNIHENPELMEEK